MMVTKIYAFAGIEIELKIPKNIVYDNERVLGKFAVEKVKNPYRFHFAVENELPSPDGKEVAVCSNYRIYSNGDKWSRYLGTNNTGWKSANMCVHHERKEHFVYLRMDIHGKKIGTKTVLNALGVEYLLLQEQGLIIHASYINCGGKAILFTAPSGTGKSTQAELWKKYRNTDIVNGDRAVIKVNNNSIEACGLPYSGSSEYCENVTLPLTTIIYLSQDNNTSIRKMTGLEAFRRVWEQISVPSWNKDAVDQISMNVLKIIKHIPIYHLCCTPDETAILAVESVLDELEMNNS